MRPWSSPDRPEQFYNEWFPVYYLLYSLWESDLSRRIFSDIRQHTPDGSLHLPHLPGCRLRNVHLVRSQEIRLPFQYPGRLGSYLFRRSSDYPEADLISFSPVVTSLLKLHFSSQCPYLLKENGSLQCTFLWYSLKSLPRSMYALVFPPAFHNLIFIILWFFFICNVIIFK